MHPIDQKMHILGQPRRVWCGILSPRTLQALAVMLLGQRRLISQHQIGHIVGQIKERWLSVAHCSMILMLVQEKQADMPQRLVLCTGQLS